MPSSDQHCQVLYNPDSPTADGVVGNSYISSDIHTSTSTAMYDSVLSSSTSVVATETSTSTSVPQMGPNPIEAVHTPSSLMVSQVTESVVSTALETSSAPPCSPFMFHPPQVYRDPLMMYSVLPPAYPAPSHVHNVNPIQMPFHHMIPTPFQPFPYYQPPAPMSYLVQERYQLTMMSNFGPQTSLPPELPSISNVDSYVTQHPWLAAFRNNTSQSNTKN
jgi:hypothetical protein